MSDAMTRLLLSVVLAPAVATAAPVPPPVGELTPHLLAGDGGTTWGYAWGGMSAGAITLLPDGTYRSRHRAGEGWDWCGWWSLESGVLVLRERRVGGESVTEYRVAVSAAGYPTVRGTCGGTPVALSNPERHAAE